jgi:hypothetical protein
VGSRTAPGAYDAVVPGMPQRDAAAILRRSGKPFARVLAEAAHGPEGPHLHIVVQLGPAGAVRSPCDAYHGQTIYLRYVNGRQNPLVACEILRKEAALGASPSDAASGPQAGAGAAD